MSKGQTKSLLESIKNKIKFTNNNFRIRGKWIRRFGMSASVMLGLVAALTVAPVVPKQEYAEAAAGTATASTTVLTMDEEQTNANVNLIVKDTQGTFASSETNETAKFSITTNNYTGYKLSIEGSDDKQQLSNSAANKVLNSIAYPTPADAFESTTSYNGQWGYLPSKYESVVNTVFRPGPKTDGTLLDETSAANTTANEYTIGLGARVNYDNPAGTYTKAFTLRLVAKPVTYTIKYADDTGDSTVANLPANETDVSTSSTSTNLSTTTPTRTNFTFLYWCDGTVSNNGTSCSGTTYTKGASFGIDQTTQNVTTLYAVWSPNITIKTNTGIGSVSLNGTSCAKTEGCTVTGLVYGQSYTLTATLNTGYKFESGAWNPGSNGSIADTASTNTTYTVGEGASAITPTATLQKYTCTKQYRLQNADGSWGNYTTDTTEQVNYGATCSYSKTVTNYKGSESGANNSAATASGTMTENGLTLQVSMYRNTFTVSLSKGTGISAVAVTGSGVKSGSGTASAVVYYGGAVTIAASLTSGYEWVNWTGSATYTSQSQSISSVTGNLSFTANGKSSCSSTISGTMQAFNPCSTIADKTTGSLTDDRDKQVYTVVKYGSLFWMTRNLAIGCNGSGSTYGSSTSSKTLTSANSNVSSNWSTPTASLTAGNSYDEARMTCSTTYGAWYNYAAASAGTITGSSNTTEASSSICPKNWRLFTSAERTTTTDFKNAFSPVTGGYYYSGSLRSTGRGYWWSSTAYGATARNYLYYDGSSLDTTSSSRVSGLYVRCVRAA